MKNENVHTQALHRKLDVVLVQILRYNSSETDYSFCEDSPPPAGLRPLPGCGFHPQTHYFFAPVAGVGRAFRIERDVHGTSPRSSTLPVYTVLNQISPHDAWLIGYPAGFAATRRCMLTISTLKYHFCGKRGPAYSRLTTLPPPLR